MPPGRVAGARASPQALTGCQPALRSQAIASTLNAMRDASPGWGRVAWISGRPARPCAASQRTVLDAPMLHRAVTATCGGARRAGGGCVCEPCVTGQFKYPGLPRSAALGSRFGTSGTPWAPCTAGAHRVRRVTCGAARHSWIERARRGDTMTIRVRSLRYSRLWRTVSSRSRTIVGRVPTANFDEAPAGKTRAKRDIASTSNRVRTYLHLRLRLRIRLWQHGCVRLTWRFRERIAPTTSRR